MWPNINAKKKKKKKKETVWKKGGLSLGRPRCPGGEGGGGKVLGCGTWGGAPMFTNKGTGRSNTQRRQRQPFLKRFFHGLPRVGLGGGGRGGGMLLGRRFVQHCPGIQNGKEKTSNRVGSKGGGGLTQHY